MSFKLAVDKVFYGPAAYEMHILARNPSLEFVTPETLESRFDEVLEEIAFCIGCVTFEWVKERAGKHHRQRMEVPLPDRDPIVITEALVIRGSGFSVVWERVE